jgi:hypothetical protein
LQATHAAMRLSSTEAMWLGSTYANAVLEQRLVTLSGTFGQATIALLGYQRGIDAQGLWATTSHEAMGTSFVTSRMRVDVARKARASAAGRVSSRTRDGTRTRKHAGLPAGLLRRFAHYAVPHSQTPIADCTVSSPSRSRMIGQTGEPTWGRTKRGQGTGTNGGMRSGMKPGTLVLSMLQP